MVIGGDLLNIAPADHDLLMDVNLRAPYIMINFFQDMLIAAGGAVINVSCIKGSRPQPGLISYCMAKAGLEMMTKSVALELARFGVRVNSVSASMMNTNFLKKAGLNDYDNFSVLKKEIETNPSNRIVRIEEVCQAIIHLTSQHSKKISGIVKYIDGAKHLTTRGQHTWHGLKADKLRAFEVGETNSVMDYVN